MIEKSYRSLSVGAQCCLLSISQSSFYNAQGERPNHVRRHHLQSRCAAVFSVWWPSWTGSPARF